MPCNLKMHLIAFYSHYHFVCFLFFFNRNTRDNLRDIYILKRHIVAIHNNIESETEICLSPFLEIVLFLNIIIHEVIYVCVMYYVVMLLSFVYINSERRGRYGLAAFCSVLACIQAIPSISR